MTRSPDSNTCQDCGTQGSRELRRRIIRNGSIQYVMQCQVCGAGSNAIARPAAMRITGGREPEDFSDELRPAYDAERHERFEQERQENRREFFRWYDEYLQTPEWKSRRRKVLMRAQGICEGCRDATATEVHHLTYDHVGEEFLWELVAICRACHERYHSGESGASA